MRKMFSKGQIKELAVESADSVINELTHQNYQEINVEEITEDLELTLKPGEKVFLYNLDSENNFSVRIYSSVLSALVISAVKVNMDDITNALHIAYGEPPLFSPVIGGDLMQLLVQCDMMGNLIIALPQEV